MLHSVVHPSGQDAEEGYKNPPDVTPRREGGDDAVAEKIIADDEADEKVLDNGTSAPPAAHPLKLDGTE